MQDNQNLKYAAYVRKSEERDERQELSHTAQVREIKRKFPELNIVEWLEPESKSAFTPGRPVFNRMMELAEQGKIDGIVSYHPNRISRNELDSATVTWAIRQGILKDLKFCDYTFQNTPEGIMMLQFIMNQSQFESAKQGKDVSRGMVQKIIQHGERPGVVPIGYMKKPLVNENGEPIFNPKDGKFVTRTAADPERFDEVSRMWRMLLSGKYTPRQIRQIANDDWGFTIRKTRKLGGCPISLSAIYRIFNNPYYTGNIVHNGELYEGKHPQMITMAEFEYAQLLLAKRGKPRNNTHGYAYTGLLKCGKCGCSIVGKTNKKFIKSTAETRVYVHYYCTRKSDARPCNQRVYTSLENLESQIDNELKKYTIIPEFKKLAIDILKRNHKLETTDRRAIHKSLENQRSNLQTRLDSLVDKLTDGVLSDEEYGQQRDRLKRMMSEIDLKLRDNEQQADNWIELCEKAFDFATYARIRFKNGDLQTKRDILTTLGQNLVLEDQKLTLTPSEWLSPIAEGYPAVVAEYDRRVTTNKKASPQDEGEVLESMSESWRASWDLNPGHPA